MNREQEIERLEHEVGILYEFKERLKERESEGLEDTYEDVKELLDWFIGYTEGRHSILRRIRRKKLSCKREAGE